MKAAYVADLTPDASITSFFLVCEKELRQTREGKPFLRLELGDPHTALRRRAESSGARLVNGGDVPLWPGL